MVKLFHSYGYTGGLFPYIFGNGCDLIRRCAVIFTELLNVTLSRLHLIRPNCSVPDFEPTNEFTTRGSWRQQAITKLEICLRKGEEALLDLSRWSWGTSRKGRRCLCRNVPSVTQWTKGGGTRWDPTCGVCSGGGQDRQPASPTHRPTLIKASYGTRRL